MKNLTVSQAWEQYPEAEFSVQLGHEIIGCRLRKIPGQEDMPSTRAIFELILNNGKKIYRSGGEMIAKPSAVSTIGVLLSSKITKSALKFFFGRMLIALWPLFVVALYDAIAGGAIRIVFLLDHRWIPVEQGANDAYHLLVLGFVSGLLMLLYVWTSSKRIVVAAAVPFVFLIEDVLFYVALPIVSSLHDALLGEGMGATHLYFPPTISAWVGWIFRRAGLPFAFDLDCVFVLNAIGALVFLLLIGLESQKSSVRKPR